MADDVGLRALGLGIRPDGGGTVHGGDTARMARMLSDRGPVAVKQLTQPMAGMLPAEAAGLQWLARQGMDAPQVLAVTEEILVLSWVDTATPSAAAARAFGAALARLHSRRAPAFGAAPTADDGWQPAAGWVGAVPIGYGHWQDWPTFYAQARLSPTAELARQRGRLAPGAHDAVQRLCAALEDGSAAVGPTVAACPIHGDLWSGNVLWRSRGAALIDPSAHGGHPETDLAMLQLFGTPHLDLILDSYQDIRPLDGGWRSRVALHQVFPLLVHAAMFGGGYGARAQSSAEAALRG